MIIPLSKELLWLRKKKSIVQKIDKYLISMDILYYETHIDSKSDKV
jgi:hypothetical protein